MTLDHIEISFLFKTKVVYWTEIKEVQALFIEPEKIRSFLKKHNAYKTKEYIKSEKKSK